MVKILPLFVVITACVPLSQTYNSGTENKALRLSDQTYEPQIKTVRLYAGNGGTLEEINPPVVPLGQWNLMLEFDDLVSSRDSYYARIVHCNANWSKSTLSDLDFMPEFNEYPINNFEFSVDTHVPYVHYWLRLPAVKLPGNYVVAVYRGSNRDDIVLTKRFMVYDQRISFVQENQLVGSVAVALRNQQINFTINYGKAEVLNPMETVNVTIRQNQRWDTMHEGVKPSFIRDNEHELEYRFFDDSKMFFGGNEFRFFDLRSLKNPGQNVWKVDYSTKPNTAYIQPDASRSQNAYAQYVDINGNYLIENYDYRDNSYSNYVNVNFTLKSPTPVPGEVFIAGALNQWSNNETNKMKYDSASHAYHKSILLKQGYYNYQYLVESDNIPMNAIEGNYFQTENQYEILVYYKSFQPMADLLIGYYVINANKR